MGVVNEIEILSRNIEKRSLKIMTEKLIREKAGLKNEGPLK